MPKKRKKENRTIKPVLHIYCEGKKTEPYYLKGYIAHTFAGARNLDIIKIEDNKINAIQLLVNTAIKAKKDCPEGDIFWVICDRESPQAVPEHLHQAAYQEAEKNNIQIALSNICFEVWLLLHVSFHNAPYNSCDDLLKNSPFQQQLQTIGISQYKKADPTLFEKLKLYLATARQNAQKLNQNTLQTAAVNNPPPYTLNPYTDVYKLLDAIDAFGTRYFE